jgi:hypothetical protein
MWLWPIFRWFQANPWAQWVAGIAAAYIAFRVWLGSKIKRERKEARKEGREEVIDQIEEQTNERVQEAREAARSTDDLNADQLRKLRAADPNNRSRVP